MTRLTQLWQRVLLFRFLWFWGTIAAGFAALGGLVLTPYPDYYTAIWVYFGLFVGISLLLWSATAAMEWQYRAALGIGRGVRCLGAVPGVSMLIRSWIYAVHGDLLVWGAVMVYWLIPGLVIQMLRTSHVTFGTPVLAVALLFLFGWCILVSWLDFRLASGSVRISWRAVCLRIGVPMLLPLMVIGVIEVAARREAALLDKQLAAPFWREIAEGTPVDRRSNAMNQRLDELTNRICASGYPSDETIDAIIRQMSESEDGVRRWWVRASAEFFLDFKTKFEAFDRFPGAVCLHCDGWEAYGAPSQDVQLLTASRLFPFLKLRAERLIADEVEVFASRLQNGVPTSCEWIEQRRAALAGMPIGVYWAWDRGCIAEADLISLQKQLGRMRGMALLLAVERYRRAHGALPKSAGDLSPRYLAEPPVNPATGELLQWELGRPGEKKHSIQTTGEFIRVLVGMSRNVVVELPLGD